MDNNKAGILSANTLSRRGFIKLAGALGAAAASASLIAGCGSDSDSGSTSASTDFDINDWDSVLQAAQGQTVNVNMMTGTVMAEWLNADMPTALEPYGINWNLTVASNTVDVVNLISSEIGGGNTDNGSVDLAWINGENFVSLKNADYLYGPLLEYLPSYAYCDPDDPNTTTDCGVPTEGYEVPFQAVWDVFWGNTDVIPQSDFPTDPDSFLEFVQKYPGMFTYAQPGNYKGTYFVDTIIAGVCGSDVWDRLFSEALEKEELRELISPALEYLRSLNPYLWNGGASFPSDGDQVIQLFADGEIACMFETSMPQSYMDQGTISAATRPFFLTSGVIHDFWYMAIPSNAANKAAALVTMNELMKPYMQVAQFNAVGYYPFSTYENMDAEGQEAYDAIEWTDGLIEPEEMNDYAISQVNGENNDLIEELWMEEVNGQ